MSGTPTEAEIQTQLKNVVDVLETLRNHVDSTYPTNPGGAVGKFDTLLQSLEGTYTAAELPAWLTSMRAALAAALSPTTAAAGLAPVLYEYGQFISNNMTNDKGFGAGFRSTSELFRTIYEWFVAGSLSVKTRNIVFGTVTAKTTPANTGALSFGRLTKDENNFNLEGCTLEKKQFRCRADQNTGTDKWAETFEVMGQLASYDSLQIPNYGSGENIRTNIYARHAGSGSGGSLLTNSSFSEYSASGTPKFTGWTEVANGASLSQQVGTVGTDYYRTHPGATTHASLKMTAPGGGGTITIRQPLTAMRVRRLDVNIPYFFRVMVNKGGATGGSVTIRMGSQSKAVALTSLVAGWNEVLIDAGQGAWPKVFDSSGEMAIDIEWTSSSSGSILIDDAIFCPWDLIDGTYYCARPTASSPVASAVDDLYTVTDTGNTPQNAKIQYWLWLTGYGYLPSSATPTLTDP